MLGAEIENPDLQDQEYAASILLNKTSYNINVEKGLDVANHVQSKHSIVFNINTGEFIIHCKFVAKVFELIQI